VLSLQLVRHFLAGWQDFWGKPSSPRRRRSGRLVLETLEDRLTPSAGVQEQYMLDLINRFRANPAAELSLILNANDANVNNDLTAFNVDQTTLAAQFAALTPAPPLAWNDILASTSLAHSQAMLTAQTQSHQVPGEADLATRIVAAGYADYSFLAENIFAYAHSIFEAEAAFAIDWGSNPPTGIQSPPGHRDNLMDPDLREVGIGLVSAPTGSTMGPLLVTQDFGTRFNIGNSYLLGNVYADANQDGFYEPGEGLGDVNLSITGSAGTFQVTTSAAGGYQIQVPAGTYQVVASGGGLAAPLSQSVVVGSVNVQADFISTQQVVRVPAAPTFSGPGASTTSTEPTISWSATSGATKYDLWVNDATTGQLQVIRNQTLATNSFTPTSPLPAGSYQAWINVTTAGGTSPWSATYSFTITPPSVTTATAPTGSTLSATPTFTWTASTGASRYDLCVSDLSTGQGQIIRQQNLTTNSFTPGTALATGSYEFWVQAFNNVGNSSGWSAGLDFTISGPAAPTWTAPIGSTVNTSPTIAWTASAGATRYDLWITNLSTGQSPVLRQQNLTTNSFTPVTPLPVGSYQAWVEAFNAAGNSGGWSAALSFSIIPPAAPTLTGPATTISTTPTLTWTASAGATQYDVCVNNLSTGQSQVIRQTVTTTSLTPVNPVSRGQYTFWVRAANSAGAFGAWSAAFNFLIDTTAPAIPTFTAPAAPTSNLTPTIAWSAGAARYDLWVNSLTTGKNQIIRQQTFATNSFTPATPLPVGSYVAWVEAFDSTNQTRGWSASFNFTITPPAAPSQVSPAGSTAITTPTFTWAAVADAVRYELWVDDPAIGTAAIIHQQSLTTNSYTPLAALAKGTYRIWVRAFNASGNAGAWSNEVDFTVA
jgi:uncharacterized protein YkwD